MTVRVPPIAAGKLAVLRTTGPTWLMTTLPLPPPSIVVKLAIWSSPSGMAIVPAALMVAVPATRSAPPVELALPVVFKVKLPPTSEAAKLVPVAALLRRATSPRLGAVVVKLAVPVTLNAPVWVKVSAIVAKFPVIVDAAKLRLPVLAIERLPVVAVTLAIEVCKGFPTVPTAPGVLRTSCPVPPIAISVPAGALVTVAVFRVRVWLLAKVRVLLKLAALPFSTTLEVVALRLTGFTLPIPMAPELACPIVMVLKLLSSASSALVRSRAAVVPVPPKSIASPAVLG